MLNRTTIYASSRRNIRLTWPLRLALRLIPIIMFLKHTLNLLQAMRCQTSPYFSYLKYGNLTSSQLDFAGDGGLLHWIGSKILFMDNDADSCLAVKMIPPASGEWDRRGSLSLLWPLFQALCLGQFVETLSCAVQGRQYMTETGMSIFEHSLAFAEAEGMLSNTLGISPFGLPRSRDNPSKPAELGQAFITRRALFQQLNTPPENLLMGLISSLNNLSSHVLGVFDKQAKFRLINTGVWGLCFMGAFTWSFLTARPESGADNAVMRFPTVCIVGFIPHLLILIGIMFCSLIYVLALILCIFSPPEDVARLPFMRRVHWARENMQANAQLSSIRIDMHQDFYTALLQIGFTALTVASEAVYLNEWQKISVARWTWLEEERMKEIEALENSNDPTQRLSVHMDMLARRAEATGKPWRSGYDRQQTVKAVKTLPREVRRRHAADGVGHLQRGGRYIMVYSFFEGIFWLVISWMKLLTNKLLDKASITRRPQWLRTLKPKEGIEEAQKVNTEVQYPDSLEFWMLSDDGVLSLPEDDHVDVEQETRRRMQFADENREPPSDDQLSANLYDWWKHGGWWGEKDDSGSYAGSIHDDDDITSVVSMSTNNDDWEDDSSMNMESGRTTPTQHHPYPQQSRNPTPLADHALDPAHLASLLDPRDPSSRQEAKMLAYHLTAPTVTTRSQYFFGQAFSNAKILTSTKYRPRGSQIPPSGPLSLEDEALLLEHLILSRRGQDSSSSRSPTPPQPSSSTAEGGDSWRAGGSGMGSGGPQCVVCQSAPRTVLAWPCRCLSLCEDCRVSLAMNNFGTCVCCRQEVAGFSRLFVP